MTLFKYLIILDLQRVTNSLRSCRSQVQILPRVPAQTPQNPQVIKGFLQNFIRPPPGHNSLIFDILARTIWQKVGNISSNKIPEYGG